MNSYRVNLSTRNVLILALAIQIAILGVFELDQLGICLPTVRQIIGFFYLCFVPGLLILRILRLRIGITETILYSVGLSLSLVMFSGALINFLYPLLGVSKPISEFPLIISFAIIIFTLISLCYLRDKDYLVSFSIDTREVFSSFVIFLLMLPFMVIIGTYLVNFHNNNLLLLIFLVTTSIIPILVAFNIISKKVFPVIIWIVAISLLFHNSLISPYIIDYDNHLEYYLANLVISESSWNTTIPINTNAMLSIVMLPPIFSIVSDVSLEFIFKILYPFIFSLVPLGLYKAFRSTFNNDEVAFFSCFFLVSIAPFFTEMLGMARQQIACFFLLLFILIIVDKQMVGVKKALLLVIFSFSLVVSHYGVSYIIMFSLPPVFLLLTLKSASSKINKSGETKTPIITPIFISLYVALAITWYMNFSQASSFNTIVRLGYHIISSLSEMFSPSTAGGLEYLTMKFPLTQQISRIFYLTYNFFITVAILSLVYSRKLNEEYNVFSVISFGWLLASIFIPYIAHGRASLGLTRLYIIMLFFLAPFCILGGIMIMEYFLTRVNVSKRQAHSAFLKLFSISIAIFLLLNTGFISETVIKDFRSSPSISAGSIIKNGSISEKNIFYGLYPMEQDVYSAKWLSQNKKESSIIYADSRAVYNVLNSYGMMGRPELNSNLHVLGNGTRILGDAYIYLRYFNNVYHVISGGLSPDLWWNFTEVFTLDPDTTANKIYSNGGSVIYYRD